MVVKNGLIVTMDSSRRVLEDGVVVIEDDRIAYVGSTVPRDFSIKDKVIDAKGRIVLPGFFSSHTHLYGMLLKSIPVEKLPKTESPPTDFTQILQSFWWPCDESLDYGSIYAAALAGGIEYVKMGVTCFADTLSAPNAVSNSLDRQENALQEVGMRGFIGFEATGRRGLSEGLDGLRENERFLQKSQDHTGRLVRGIVGLHAPFTLSDDALLKAREMASMFKAPIHMHCCEGLGEVYHSYELYGVRPLERLSSLSFLGKDVCLAHCIQVNLDPDIKILKSTETKVAHDPWPNMYEGAGLSPVPEMLQAGVTVGLGDDAYVLDPFQNMRFFMSAHSGLRRDPRLINPHLAMELYTKGSSACFGMEGLLGSIEVGKLADLIIVEPHVKTIPLSPSNIYDYVVNFIDGDDVKTSIINGEVVMEERNLLKIDEEKAYALCRKEASGLWDRISMSEPRIDFLRPRQS